MGEQTFLPRRVVFDTVQLYNSILNKRRGRVQQTPAEPRESTEARRMHISPLRGNLLSFISRGCARDLAASSSPFSRSVLPVRTSKGVNESTRDLITLAFRSKTSAGSGESLSELGRQTLFRRGFRGCICCLNQYKVKQLDVQYMSPDTWITSFLHLSSGPGVVYLGIVLYFFVYYNIINHK